MKKIFILLLVFALPVAAQQFGQVGTSGAQFLKINFDPRASALGYAAASVVDNVSAVYTNVAGIESIAQGDVAFAYIPYFAGLKFVSAAGAYRLGDVGVIAIHGGGFSADEEVTTVEQENGTGEMYRMSNLTFGVAFARRITDKLAIGVQGKFIRESYAGHSSSAVAFDIGSAYDLGFAGAKLALTLQNFGPDIEGMSGSYIDYSDNMLQKDFQKTPLPVTFRASFSAVPYSTETYSVRVIGDLVHPNDNTEHYNIGTEITLYDFLALRGGVKLNYDDESFALGIGINGAKFLGQNIRLDYSFEKFRILSSVQKFSLGFAL